MRNLNRKYLSTKFNIKKFYINYEEFKSEENWKLYNDLEKFYINYEEFKYVRLYF